MKHTKICKNCNKKFNTYHDKVIYCSRVCYFKKRWGYEKSKKCNFCGKEVENRRYCSIKCQRGFWNKNDYRLLKKRRYWERKKELVKKLGSKCVRCGNEDLRVLDINHIDRSKKERPKTKNKYSMSFSYNNSFRIKEWNKNIDNLELLCANCHRIHTWKQMGYGIY